MAVFPMMTPGAGFGWKEIITAAALGVALGGAVVQLLNYVLARRSAEPAIDVQKSFVGYISICDTHGIGRVMWYWTLDITNRGGRATSLMGFRRGSIPRMAVGVRAGALLPDQIAAAIYVFDRPMFRALSDVDESLRGIQPRDLEELGSMNVAIPPGETKALSSALAIDNSKIPVDGYMISLKLAFNNGRKYDLSQCLQFSGGIHDA